MLWRGISLISGVMNCWQLQCSCIGRVIYSAVEEHHTIGNSEVFLVGVDEHKIQAYSFVRLLPLQDLCISGVSAARDDVGAFKDAMQRLF